MDTDQFGNIINNATTQANQTYNTDTANAGTAQLCKYRI